MFLQSLRVTRPRSNYRLKPLTMTWPFYDAVFDGWRAAPGEPNASFTRRFTTERTLTLGDAAATSWFNFHDHIFSRNFNKYYKAWGGGVVVGEGEHRLIKAAGYVRATYTFSPQAYRKHTVRMWLTTVQMHGCNGQVQHPPRGVQIPMVDDATSKLCLLDIDNNACMRPELLPANLARLLGTTS